MRLAHYAAPEIRGTERIHGLIAKQKLEEFLPIGDIVRINSKKTDKYGRWLADVEFKGSTLSEYLISLGYGVLWDGLGLNPKFDPSAPYPITVGTDKV